MKNTAQTFRGNRGGNFWGENCIKDGKEGDEVIAKDESKLKKKNNEIIAREGKI